MSVSLSRSIIIPNVTSADSSDPASRHSTASRHSNSITPVFINRGSGDVTPASTRGSNAAAPVAVVPVTPVLTSATPTVTVTSPAVDIKLDGVEGSPSPTQSKWEMWNHWDRATPVGKFMASGAWHVTCGMRCVVCACDTHMFDVPRAGLSWLGQRAVVEEMRWIIDISPVAELTSHVLLTPSHLILSLHSSPCPLPPVTSPVQIFSRPVLYRHMFSSPFVSSVRFGYR